MKTLSFGDKLAFSSQHVFHLLVLDDFTKKKAQNNPYSYRNLGEEHSASS